MRLCVDLRSDLRFVICGGVSKMSTKLCGVTFPSVSFSIRKARPNPGFLTPYAMFFRD